MPEVVAELHKSMYVDDLLSGGHTVEQAQERKSKATAIFNNAKFVLHKWASNVTELEDNCNSEEVNSELTYMPNSSWIAMGQKKRQVNYPFSSKHNPANEERSKLAKVYDPLGLVSPLTLQGKLIYCDICKQKLPWDAKLSKPFIER